MPPLHLLLLLWLIAPAARGQTLIDAAGAAAIQGTLQGASAPGYTNLLRDRLMEESRALAPAAAAIPSQARRLTGPPQRRLRVQW